MREIVEKYREYMIAFLIGMSIVGGIYSIISVLMARTERFLLAFY